jgi:Fic family protein
MTLPMPGGCAQPARRWWWMTSTAPVFHVPPPAEELPQRLEALCLFANGETPQVFIHPVLRAIALHFWLAYDHPPP